MKNTVISFTDAHGVTHAGAVFELQYAHRHLGTSEIIGEGAMSNQTVTVNYIFKYWYSQETKDAGLQPSVLVSLQGNQSFDVYPPITEAAVDLETFCINHLTTVTLPAIDPAAVVTMV